MAILSPNAKGKPDDFIIFSDEAESASSGTGSDYEMSAKKSGREKLPLVGMNLAQKT